MSIQKRLRHRVTHKRSAHSGRMIGYYRGAKVTWWRRGDQQVMLSVVWPNGSRWDVGPCGTHSRAGEILTARKVDVMSFLKKVDVSQAQGAHPLYIAEGILKQMPAIVEYLSMEQWPDGTARERSSLLVIVESQMVKVCLTDRANNRSLWRAGPTLDECLLAMEVALQNDECDWRQSAPKGEYGGKKKR